MMWLRELVELVGCNSVAELSIRFVNSQDWIDGIVVGVDTCEQLAENINFFSKGPLLNEQLYKIGQLEKPFVADETLNPVMWKIGKN